jgi:hypothetical protein
MGGITHERGKIFWDPGRREWYHARWTRILPNRIHARRSNLLVACDQGQAQV